MLRAHCCWRKYSEKKICLFILNSCAPCARARVHVYILLRFQICIWIACTMRWFGTLDTAAISPARCRSVPESHQLFRICLLVFMLWFIYLLTKKKLFFVLWLFVHVRTVGAKYCFAALRIKRLEYYFLHAWQPSASSNHPSANSIASLQSTIPYLT